MEFANMTKTTKTWLITAAMLILLAAGVIVLFTVDLSQISVYLVSLGVFGMVLGIMFVYLQTFFPFVPFVILAGANVAIFGTVWGFIINYVMACLGATTAFIIARKLGHDWVERKISKYPGLRGFNEQLGEHGFFYILLGRLIPIIPSSAISVGAGVSKISTRAYMLGTWIGKVPMVFLETLIAHDVIFFKEHKSRFFLLIAVFVVLMLIGHYIKSKFMPKKNNNIA
jgi:uncharacterized membrane protein YdjX (TVP38/TMEM64 family)